MRVCDAKQTAHTLSNTSKMGCFSYSIPAKYCKTGSKLRKIKGSVCYGCYAHKNAYAWSTTQNAMQKRYNALEHGSWSEAMAVQINSKKKPYFRWHDSGDVQDEAHLMKIFEVCKLTPNVKHWLPTHEAWVLDYQDSAPDNLTIRFSLAMVEQPRPAKTKWRCTSGVSAKAYTCPAPDQDNQCKQCRLCWDKSVPHIIYKEH